MQVKKIKMFSELFTNNIFEYSFVLFISNQSLGSHPKNCYMAPKSVGKAMQSFQSAANPRILTFTSAVCIFESKS